MLWVLDTKKFKENIAFHNYTKKKERIEFIKQIKMFERWKPERLQEFNLSLGERHLETN